LSNQNDHEEKASKSLLGSFCDTFFRYSKR